MDRERSLAGYSPVGPQRVGHDWRCDWDEQAHLRIVSFSVSRKLSVQFSRSVMSNSVTPWTTARQASLSITNSLSPPKPVSIELVMSSNHLILCCPLLLLLQSFPASGSLQMSQLFASVVLLCYCTSLATTKDSDFMQLIINLQTCILSNRNASNFFTALKHINRFYL